jgi:hypothetical protein
LVTSPSPATEHRRAKAPAWRVLAASHEGDAGPYRQRRLAWPALPIASALGAIASLIETVKPNGIDPYAYFAGVITRIVAGYPQRQIAGLPPWACAPTSFQAVA